MTGRAFPASRCHITSAYLYITLGVWESPPPRQMGGGLDNRIKFKENKDI